MKWWQIALNVIGIGKSALENRQLRKKAELNTQLKIEEARAKAQVARINSNTISDNEIDLITAQNKSKTFKDEFLTYLLLMPLVVATLEPFVRAYKTGNWDKLNHYFLETYTNLDKLPDWWMYAFFAVIIDVLGFRSFARKIVNNLMDRWFKKGGNITKLVNSKT